MTIFARVFAYGTLAHVLEFLLEQTPVGSITQYMERWSRMVPSTGWSSHTGLALQSGVVAFSLLMLILPYSRELLCVLAVVFFLSEFASPGRIASHCSMMTGGLLIILLLAIAEWIDVAMRRRRQGAPSTEWYAWTLIGLRWICALTYFFAFFFKLNPGWFSAGGKAPEFLIRPLEPMLRIFGIGGIGAQILAPVAVYGTLLVEILLPMLLLFGPTRLVGCLIGLALSAGMAGQGVADFPVLIVAFYAAFLSRSEAHELLDRCSARPSIGKAITILLIVSTWFIEVRTDDTWMFARQDAPRITAMYTMAGFVSFAFLSYLAITFGQWLWESGFRPVAPGADELPHQQWGGAKFLSMGVVALVAIAFVFNNLAGFFALPSFGPMYMFSGMNADLSNHYLMPRIPLTQAFDFVSVTRFETSDRKSRAAHEFQWLQRWLRMHTRPVEVNLNVVRYHMIRLCDASPKPTVRLKLVASSGETRDYDDVCATPEMLWYVPLPVASVCNPRCAFDLTNRIRREFHHAQIDALATGAE